MWAQRSENVFEDAVFFGSHQISWANAWAATGKGDPGRSWQLALPDARTHVAKLPTSGGPTAQHDICDATAIALMGYDATHPKEVCSME